MSYCEDDRVEKTKVSQPSHQPRTTISELLFGKSLGFYASVKMENKALDLVRDWELELGFLHKAEVGNELFLP